MDKKLLDAEWTILRALWGRLPQTLREIVAAVQKEQPEISWQYKTYHSYLRIMLEKGLIGCEDKNLRDKLYYALVTREEALRQESETLLARVSAGSMGALVLAMAQSAPLTDEDRRALVEMAARLEHAKGGERNGE
jgi:BlaI family penicillinase repressor